MFGMYFYDSILCITAGIKYIFIKRISTTAVSLNLSLIDAITLRVNAFDSMTIIIRLFQLVTIKNSDSVAQNNDIFNWYGMWTYIVNEIGFNLFRIGIMSLGIEIVIIIIEFD